MENLINNTMNFMSFKCSEEERAMHLKSDNIKIMVNDKADKVIEEVFESLHSRYQLVLEKSLMIVDLSLIILIYVMVNVI